MINPIGIVPIVLSLTEHLNIKEYNRTISKGAILACCILLLFALMGKLIFSFYEPRALLANLYELAIMKKVCGCEDEAYPKVELSQICRFFLNSPLLLDITL